MAENRDTGDRRVIRDTPFEQRHRVPQMQQTPQQQTPQGQNNDRPVVRRSAGGEQSKPQQGAQNAARQQRAAQDMQNTARQPRVQQPQPDPQRRAQQDVPEVRYQTRGQRPGQPRQRVERIDPNQRERANWQQKQAQRKKKRRLQQVIGLVLALVLGISIFAIVLAVDLGGGANTFYEGVAVDGLKLNGYTMEEAKEKLEVLNADRVASMAVRLAYSGREWTISPEQMGVELDIDEKLEQAWNLGREGGIFKRQKEIRRLRKNGQELTTVMSYDIGMVESRLNEVKASVDLAAHDATVQFDPQESEEKFKIVQESNGRNVDLATLLQQVKNQLDNGYTTLIDVKPDVVYPSLKAEDLEKATARLSRVKTSLGSSSDARIHNIKTVLTYFNGMVVQPGQEVSFNQTTGPRGLEEGYQNAGVIQDDEIIDGPGGGVCQASTTLYQALVKGGIEIVRSNKHSLPVSYVDAGTDAAVAYDYKDLVFRNNTQYPIFIEGRVSGSSVVVAVYGYPMEEGTEIKIVTDVYETIQPLETKIILDTAAEHVIYTDETKVKKKSREGIKVKSYRVVMKDGQEVSRELLRDDYYKEVQGETYQGVTPREGGAPAQTPGSGIPEE